MPAFHEWLDYVLPAPDLPPDKDFHICITFRPAHRQWVSLLKELLQYANFLVHLDQVSDPIDAPLRSALDRGLGRSQCGILVWDRTEADSTWHRLEHETMMKGVNELGLRYVPLLLDEMAFDPPEGVTPISFAGKSEFPHGEGLLRVDYATLGEHPADEAIEFARAVDRDLERARDEIEALRGAASHLDVLAAAEGDSMAWESFPVLRCLVAEVLIEKGTFDEALGVLDRVNRDHPLNIRCDQLRGWILSRQGNFEEAEPVFAKLEGESTDDPTTQELLARHWVDRYYQTGEEIKLRSARGFVAHALRIHPEALTVAGLGASISALLGEPEIAEVYARRALTLLKEHGEDGRFGHGCLAAEARLILGEVEAAIDAFQSALARPARFPWSSQGVAFGVNRLLEILPVPAEKRDQLVRLFGDVV